MQRVLLGKIGIQLVLAGCKNHVTLPFLKDIKL